MGRDSILVAAMAAGDSILAGRAWCEIVRWCRSVIVSHTPHRTRVPKAERRITIHVLYNFTLADHYTYFTYSTS